MTEALAIFLLYVAGSIAMSFLVVAMNSLKGEAREVAGQEAILIALVWPTFTTLLIAAAIVVLTDIIRKRFARGGR